MNLQALMGQFLSQESIQGISHSSGASQKDVQSVLSAALPALLNGANEQAQNQQTAAGFAGALNQHAANSTGNLGTFFQNVDLDDGAKIVSHLLGANTGTHTQSVSQQAGISSAKTGKILAAAAPLLMSLLGQQTQSSQPKPGNVGGLLSSLLGKADLSQLALSLLGAETPSTGTNGKKKKKKPAKKDDGVDLGDVASLITGLLK